MTPSVSPEADWELTKEAVLYAREGGAELGLALITEFERALPFSAIIRSLAHPGETGDVAFLSGSFRSASSTTPAGATFEWLRSRTIDEIQIIGAVASDDLVVMRQLRPNKRFDRSAKQQRCLVPVALRAPVPGQAWRSAPSNPGRHASHRMVLDGLWQAAACISCFPRRSP